MMTLASGRSMLVSPTLEMKSTALPCFALKAPSAPSRSSSGVAPWMAKRENFFE